MYLPRPGAHRFERIRDGIFRIVMGMNAQPVARYMLRHLFNDVVDFMRQGAAIGVAQHDPARAGLIGGHRTGQGEVGIGLEPVEEMFRIVHRLAAAFDRKRNGIADHRDVFLVTDFQRDIDMEIPRFADQTGGIGLRVQDRR